MVRVYALQVGFEFFPCGFVALGQAPGCPEIVGIMRVIVSSISSTALLGFLSSAR